MTREELIEELPSLVRILRAQGVLPEGFDAWYGSWDAVQHGEAGDRLEGELYLVASGWLYIYDIMWSSGTERATQRVVPPSQLGEITRTWSGGRGFDDSDVFTTADEYALTITLGDNEVLTFPRRPTDYNESHYAWRQAHHLADALIRGR